jgi:hypothetical protein
LIVFIPTIVINEKSHQPVFFKRRWQAKWQIGENQRFWLQTGRAVKAFSYDGAFWVGLAEDRWTAYDEVI